MEDAKNKKTEKIVPVVDEEDQDPFFRKFKLNLFL
jgi:hypothetical protein